MNWIHFNEKQGSHIPNVLITLFYKQVRKTEKHVLKVQRSYISLPLFSLKTISTVNLKTNSLSLYSLPTISETLESIYYQLMGKRVEWNEFLKDNLPYISLFWKSSGKEKWWMPIPLHSLQKKWVIATFLKCGCRSIFYSRIFYRHVF